MSKVAYISVSNSAAVSGPSIADGAVGGGRRVVPEVGRRRGMSEDEDDEEDNDDDDDDDAVRVVEGVVGKGVNVISASCLRHHCVKLLEGKRNEWR